MTEDLQIIVGAPMPKTLAEAMQYHPLSRVIDGTCGHKVVLSPLGGKFYAEHRDYKVICNDCVEAFSILYTDGTVGTSMMLPGSEEALAELYGKEEAARVIEEGRPEMERRTNTKFAEYKEPKPTWEDLYGIDPDYTEGKNTDEWLEDNRGEA